LRRVLSSILGVLAVAGALVVILLLVSLIATEEGSSEVAREGQLAVSAEAALSSTSALRNASAQALILEQGRAQSWVNVESVDRAVGQLNLITGEYVRRTGQLIAGLEGDEASTVEVATAVFLADTKEVIAALSAVPTPGIPRATSLPSGSYEDAATALVGVRDDRAFGVLAEAEYAGQAADAVRFLVIVVIPIIVMVVLRSVFKRRRERDGFQSELARQTAVIKSKDEFVANLSHELRTPLTGVYGFALALDEAGYDDPDTARELTGLIINDAAELSRMVDDLITAGQVETGNVALAFEEIELDPEIQTVLEPFQRAGASIAFNGNEDKADIDRLRFRQVIRNLVSNAVKHGGPNIDVFTEYGGGVVSIFVMDDGDGIADDRVSRLFERYHHEGTGPLLEGSVGLGLAIARSLSLGMGGTLSYTRSGGLTYFVLQFPSHRVGKLTERVDEQSLGDEKATQSASEVAKLFAR
jgi:signal transduction histidine kinase